MTILSGNKLKEKRIPITFCPFLQEEIPALASVCVSSLSTGMERSNPLAQADPMPSKMGHEKGVTLTYFMSLKNRSCISHCIWNLVTRCQRGGRWQSMMFMWDSAIKTDLSKTPAKSDTSKQLLKCYFLYCLLKLIDDTQIWAYLLIKHQSRLYTRQFV